MACQHGNTVPEVFLRGQCEVLCSVRIHGWGSPWVRTPTAHQLRWLLFLSGWLLSAILPATSSHNTPTLLQETLPAICPFPIAVLNFILGCAWGWDGRPPPASDEVGARLNGIECCSQFMTFPILSASGGLTWHCKKTSVLPNWPTAHQSSRNVGTVVHGQLQLDKKLVSVEKIPLMLPWIWWPVSKFPFSPSQYMISATTSTLNITSKWITAPLISCDHQTALQYSHSKFTFCQSFQPIIAEKARRRKSCWLSGFFACILFLWGTLCATTTELKWMWWKLLNFKHVLTYKLKRFRTWSVMLEKTIRIDSATLACSSAARVYAVYESNEFWE